MEVTSKYYDAAGQAVASVTILLYHGRDLLATVTARQGEAFAQMKVEYSGRLAGQ